MLIPEYQAPTNVLADKTIVITGGGSGIGKAIALGFAECGATVVLLGRTMSNLEETYDEIEDKSWPTPAIYNIDFLNAQEQDYINVQLALQKEFGSIDGLILNASVLGKHCPFGQINYEEWQNIMQVNVNATFALTKNLLPLLQLSQDARILYTSSAVGRQGRAYWGAYAASNAAVENMIQCLADELEETSIRVNSINPGSARTAMRAKAYPAEDPMQIKPPEALVNSYLYLFAPESNHIHGRQFEVQP